MSAPRFQVGDRVLVTGREGFGPAEITSVVGHGDPREATYSVSWEVLRSGVKGGLVGSHGLSEDDLIAVPAVDEPEAPEPEVAHPRYGATLWCGHWTRHARPGQHALLSFAHGWYSCDDVLARCDQCKMPVPIRDANVNEPEPTDEHEQAQLADLARSMLRSATADLRWPAGHDPYANLRTELAKIAGVLDDEVLDHRTARAGAFALAQAALGIADIPETTPEARQSILDAMVAAGATPLSLDVVHMDHARACVRRVLDGWAPANLAGSGAPPSGWCWTRRGARTGYQREKMTDPEVDVMRHL